ncbi:uncharacterized protein LOC142973884 [Anticarsia gemmatalis]|uniref:uncharacterized protein LOC142973884 n=1 Tax=Anticarsia gemmatalis TaxID=129554 RepID=UPI003F7704E0
MLKKLKLYLNKDGCDYSKGLVDPFEFHQTFHRVLVAFKVADIENKQKPTWLNQNAVIFLSGLIATILTFISMGHGVEIFDIPFITESGTYFIVMFYELLILSCTKRNLPQYHKLLRAMQDDFYYICTDGEKYRQKYFENQLLTWKICIFACVFTASIAVGMVVFATLSLLYFLATNGPDDEGSRPLLFPFWLPHVDFGKTPVYETAFIYSNTTAMLYSYNYIFMIQTQIVWIRHITSKCDIVVWSIEDLMNGVYPAANEQEYKYFSTLLVSRMRKIVKHHQEMLSVMEAYAIVYKKLLMFEQKCCGPVVCLTAYCTLEKFEEGDFQPILPLLCFATIVLHFIPSYLCTYLALKVRSICDACWSVPFWLATPVIRPYMVLMMQRALRPLPLHAPGFESISVETFSKKMTSAYSFFNMLRQTNL